LTIKRSINQFNGIAGIWVQLQVSVIWILCDGKTLNGEICRYHYQHPLTFHESNFTQEIYVFVLSFFSLICVSNGCLVLHIIHQVGWDESTAGEKRSRVSIWEIEPVTAPFFLCPPPFFRSKRPRQPGMPGK